MAVVAMEKLEMMGAYEESEVAAVFEWAHLNL